MRYKVRVTQVLRVERSAVVEIEAASIEDAIEAIGDGDVDLPPAPDMGSEIWTIDRSSVENEQYFPGA